MSQVSIEGRIESLPIEVQEAMRDIVRELNDMRSRVQTGSGSPEGVIVGYPGWIWQRTDGGAGTATYIFEGTAGSATGWVAL
jgi:hypothetical protein